MPYKRTNKAPGRPLADPEAEAERQRKWQERQDKLAARKEQPVKTRPKRVRRRFMAAKEREADKGKRRRHKKAPKRVGFGAYASPGVQAPIQPIIGMRAQTAVRRRTLVAPPQG